MNAEDFTTVHAHRQPQDEDLRLASADVVRAAKTRILQLFDLAAAEVRLAAMSTLSMLLLVIVAAAALIIAWALVVAVAIYLLAGAGVPWAAAASVFALTHVLIAYLMWRLTVKLSRNLTLPALRGVMSASSNLQNHEEPYVPVETATATR